MADVEKLLDEGKKLLDKGEFKKAMKKFNDALKEDPENPEAHFGKAEASLGLPKITLVEIAQNYRNAIKYDEKNIFYLTSYGDFCLANGLLKQAEENYLKAIELDPDSSALYYSDLALGYYKNGKLFLDRQLDMTEVDVTRNALNYIMKAFKIESDKAKELLNAIITNGEWTDDRPNDDGITNEKIKLEKLPEFSIIEKEINKDEGNPFGYLNLGQYCFDNNFLFSGEAQFLKAIELAEEEGTDFYSDLAISYYMSGMDLLGKKQLEGFSEDQILRNSFKYFLKSLNLPPEKALDTI
ncbi:MAG: tetratricopeptide repeat protein [Thermoplasmata archaeon]|nr:MAG: tetratricopeptide repeat protein [Thermoplasmata archaeon]